MNSTRTWDFTSALEKSLFIYHRYSSRKPTLTVNCQPLLTSLLQHRDTPLRYPKVSQQLRLAHKETRLEVKIQLLPLCLQLTWERILPTYSYSLRFYCSIFSRWSRFYSRISFIYVYLILPASRALSSYPSKDLISPTRIQGKALNSWLVTKTTGSHLISSNR